MSDGCEGFIPAWWVGRKPNGVLKTFFPRDVEEARLGELYLTLGHLRILEQKLIDAIEDKERVLGELGIGED